MPKPSPVLVATDLSPAADEALRQGSVVAQAWNVPLVVCHILPEAFRVRVLFPHEAGVDPGQTAALERSAGDALRARVEEVLPIGAPLTIEIDSGSAPAGILEIADRVGARLIVLGPGRTAHRVAQAGACHVLVARTSPPGGMVIGASDFSDAALPALRAAAEAHRRTGAGLRVIHCLDVDQPVAMAAVGAAGAMAMPMLPDDIYQNFRAAAQDRLTRALAALGVDGETDVLRRSPGQGIVADAVAAKASLVVVGTRGGTTLRRWFLGSTAEHVMTHAPCSVLVVPLDATPHPTTGDALLAAVPVGG